MAAVDAIELEIDDNSFIHNLPPAVKAPVLVSASVRSDCVPLVMCNQSHAWYDTESLLGVPQHVSQHYRLFAQVGKRHVSLLSERLSLQKPQKPVIECS